MFSEEKNMLTITQISAENAPVEPLVAPPQTRFETSPTDLPLTTVYSSIFDDLQTQINIHKYRDRLRQNALHPVKLHAGQSAMPNGGIGRFVRPQLPEVIGGGLVGINL